MGGCSQAEPEGGTGERMEGERERWPEREGRCRAVVART